MISQSTIERIKDIPVYEVIRHYVELKKTGATYRGLSPWHDEKTPSFYVVPSKNIYKDFSSGKGGSAINFVMEKLNLSYPDAIKEIAGKCGERVEYDQPTPELAKENDHKETLYKFNEATARAYANQLKTLLDTAGEVHPALTEITKRNFTPDTIVQWQLGYAPGDTQGFAPNQWKFITNLAGDKHYATALELNLIHSKAGHTYDTFRHRLIYPIHNHHGRVVGFGGRALQSTVDGQQSTDYTPAKYINSNESKIYKKDTVLFGLHHAGKTIRECGYAYLMEGYTDVISFHQAGFGCSVGTCGTALTESQCDLLRKYTGKVVLFYDGDDAGQKATLRAIDMLVSHGFETAVVPMPVFDDGRKVDPDELTRLFSNQLITELAN